MILCVKWISENLLTKWTMVLGCPLCVFLFGVLISISDKDLFIISIFLQLKETAQLYMYNSLLQANINVRAIAQGCSEFNITVVVKREDCIKALKAVHSRFYLSRTTIAVGIIGPGLIGSTLLEQLKDQVLFFIF